MTKQDLNEIIKQQLTTKLQTPDTALKDIERTFGIWLRKIAQNAQTRASNANMQAQAGGSNGGQQVQAAQ